MTKRNFVFVGLMAVLAVALAFRLHGIGFGLPALYDPDEPIFFLTGLKLLKEHTLNPGWFGHPGTTTIYAMAVIEAGVLATGLATGRFVNVKAFATAIYADPGVVLLPGRFFILICGMACVLLVFLIARSLWNERVGLGAAALLAVNPLHIGLSQIVRTDVQASVFMLLCVAFAVRIVRRGRRRDYLAAAVCVGFACATKWPGATVLVAIFGAAAQRWFACPEERRRISGNLALVIPTMLAAVFVASPYIFLAASTTLANVAGEAQTKHLGATGGDFGTNVAWYVTQPMRDSLGWLGVVLVVVGIAFGMRDRVVRATILPVVAVFFVAICSQRLIWARWIVPLMPFFAMLAAAAVAGLAARLRAYAGARATLAGGVALSALLVGPIAATAYGRTIERVHDTRALASAWVRSHIPRGKTITLEHLALDLRGGGWLSRFPLGQLGCVDGEKLMTGQINVSGLADVRGGQALVDIGTMAPDKVLTCRVDYVMVSDYDRYLAEAALFPQEIAVYRRLLSGATQVAVFSPRPGAVGGPVVRIFRFAKAAPPTTGAVPKPAVTRRFRP